MGVTGTYEPDPSQTVKYINPQVYRQEISPDSGYATMDKVVVYGVGSSIDSNIKAGNIRSGVKILGVTGTIEAVNGGQITIEPAVTEQFITPPEGKNAITEVVVKPVTSTIDDKIIASNIKEGINILGVEGTFNGGLSTLQTKHVTPREGAQEITADDGYDALATVIVEPTPVETIKISPSIENKTYHKNDGVFIETVEVEKVTSDIDINIQPENIKQNMSILGVVGTYVGEPSPVYFSAYGKGDSNKTRPGVVDGIIKLPDNIVVTGTDASYMFAGLPNLKELPMVDLTNITTMNCFASGCTSLTSVPPLNISKVTNLNYAFEDTGLTSIPDLDYSSVTSAHAAFSGSKITQLPTRLDLMFPKCTSMSYAFADCPIAITGPVELHIGGWGMQGPYWGSPSGTVPEMNFYIHKGGASLSGNYNNQAFFKNVNYKNIVVHYVDGGYIKTGEYIFGANYDQGKVTVNSQTRVNSDTPLTFNMVGATDCEYMFSYAFGDGVEAKLILPDVTTINYMCQYTHVGKLNVTLSTKCAKMRGAFVDCYSMHSLYGPNDGDPIEAGGVDDISGAYMNKTALVNFGGLKDLGKAYTRSANNSYCTFNISSCTNLSHDSLMNVINNLWDLAASGKNAQKCVLGATNLAKLTAEEIAIATNKGWNVS